MRRRRRRSRRRRRRRRRILFKLNTLGSLIVLYIIPYP
jgi:hypothetical protein